MESAACDPSQHFSFAQVGFNYVAYLHSKRSVDARALNARVWDALLDKVAVTPPAGRDDEFRVLEVGCGVGDMCVRFLTCARRGRRKLRYVLVDNKLENLEAARRGLLRLLGDKALARSPGKTHVSRRADSQDRESVSVSVAGDHSVHAKASFEKRNAAMDMQICVGESSTIGPACIEFVCADALQYCTRSKSSEHEEQENAPFDLLIAAAFLDLVDIRASLPILFSCLKARGMFYFPINFDGTTHFSPSLHEDEEIEQEFHAHMDMVNESGATVSQSRAGRKLLEYIPRAGGNILCAGSSAWVVMPSTGFQTAGPRYEENEAYFLHCILSFIEDTLSGSEMCSSKIDQDTVMRYIQRRRAHVDAAELSYLAHNVDVFGTVDVPMRNK
ncbi:hypothetical protein FVE85_6589 [Porphyridium purpureum]|uniref:Methyltransferase domain-containing protein n=1 Tax=Porphyridium purpureum TaxID=35688 RepID=A0A5J4Z7M3_PORPP|nr:hypothetical protein FVE85_6589 [Porphyridium purpureum]|eukprot:POR6709..scf295_1